MCYKVGRGSWGPRCELPLIQDPFGNNSTAIQHCLQPTLTDFWLVKLGGRVYKTFFPGVVIQPLPQFLAARAFFTVRMASSCLWRPGVNRGRRGSYLVVRHPCQLESILVILGHSYDVFPRKLHLLAQIIDYLAGAGILELIDVALGQPRHKNVG